MPEKRTVVTNTTPLLSRRTHVPAHLRRGSRLLTPWLHGRPPFYYDIPAKCE